ncbi:MAG: PIN domain-containing protein [Planctomycetota bacterium]|nr:PIN domain-containing protein [Planctomycetota bacterium]
MPGYLLDTQTISYWFDEKSEHFPAVEANARGRAADSPLYVSAITLGEIEYGHALNPDGAGAKRDEFLRLLRKELPQTLEVSHDTAEPYGRVRAHLAQKFPPAGGWSKKKRAEQMYDPVAARELGIDENDLWLVAQAVERNLVLVSSDKMRRIREVVVQVYSGFRAEDWSVVSPAGA